MRHQPRYLKCRARAEKLVKRILSMPPKPMPIRTLIRTPCRLAWVFAICASLHAQDYNLITVTLRDGRTGKKITPSNFLLRVDHFETVHGEWVKIYDDGTVAIRVPPEAKAISLQATYESGMDTYINCDAAKPNDPEREIWYPVEVIMKAGVVAPNECSKTA